MRNWFLGSSLALALLGGASSGARAQPGPPAPEKQQPPADESLCPMVQSSGARIATSNTRDGVALSFTTAGDVGALRAHVRRMADMQNHRSGMHPQGGMPGRGMGPGAMGSGMHDRMGMGMMVPSRATVQDIPGGARMVMVPSDPAQLPALRDQVASMTQRDCPRMGPGAPPAPSRQPDRRPPPGA